VLDHHLEEASMWKDFKAFIMRGNVLDLAVAVVIAGAFGAIVKSAVDDIIMPPVGLLLGGIDFSNLFMLIKAGPKAPPPYASLADAKAAGAVTLNYGVFLNTVITFLIVALAVFIVVRIATPLPSSARRRPTEHQGVQILRDRYPDRRLALPQLHVPALTPL
jgi:large conductance mechanosensitive channel